MLKLKLLAPLTLLLTLMVSNSWAETQEEKAPAFSLPDLYSGELQNLEQYRGKVVYLDFWASWCGPCRQSLPLLNTLRDELGKDKFEVVAINLDENPEDGKRFLEKYPVGYPVLTDTTGDTPQKYQLTGMPTSYIIDQKGNIRGAHQGFRTGDIDKIREAVKKLIQEGDNS
ncbi:TlpA family protein disulfide reductase [Alkalimarinus sediminis]|uniref:TlpA family protein disulfide reductase n=1 Tax=Alkalimarinus sediminis TaxID=1632866 RepID=A0A9E8HIF7_9ALTE|nr:TlpA disulfide reductase family protein [Alkalimarinus sediminis]UZW75268.1 TlpA family protein disulfide reductase [Alkalimarinus sediminis]